MSTGQPPPPGGDASAPAPAPFPEDELLALLRDASVSPEAIAAEMEDAGAAPLDAGVLAVVRAALVQGDAAGADAVAGLAAPLRARVLREAAAARHSALLVEVARSADKAAAKEAKRAIHLLRARGVAVEVPRAEPAPAPGPAPEPATAWASSPDGYGDRILFFPVSGRGGGSLVQVVISDEEGMREAQLVPLGKRGFRRVLDELAATRMVLVGEVPRSWARGAVTAALDLNARGSRPVPEGWNEVAVVLGPSVAPQPSPGRALAQDAEAAALVSRSAELLDLSEVAPWIPGEEELRALSLRLDEISVSPLYLDEAQREASGRSAVVDAIRAYWTAERRWRVAGRLFELAWLLRGAGRGDQARLAAATGAAMESDAPLESVPFCYALFEKVVRFLRRDRRNREETGDATRRSPGGIILP